MKSFLEKMFSSLKIRNFRIYYIGQIISVSGTFLQALAQDWLVLKLTNSGTLLGLALAFQFGPVLLFGAYGGVIADRFPKMKILYFTQGTAGVLALVLGILVVSGNVTLWEVFASALCLGLLNSVDNPTRQTFVGEMVGKDQIKNAVSLWAILISVCRVIGPALAGVLIATVGLGLCFIINAASYIAVIIGMCLIDKSLLHTSPTVPPSKRQIREGLKYIKRTPILFYTLVMMGIVGTITFEWQASLPLFAKFVLGGDAATYSILSSSIGVGMLLGGLFTASRGKSDLKQVTYTALFFGIFTCISAFTRNLIEASIVLGFAGAFGIMFANLSNSTLQINSDPKMRGRVMSLWAMAFFGSTAIGGPFIGWVGEVFGARWSLGVGGVAAILASAYGLFALSKQSDERESSVL